MHIRTITAVVLIPLIILLTAAPAWAQSTGTTTLSVTVAAAVFHRSPAIPGSFASPKL